MTYDYHDGPQPEVHYELRLLNTIDDFKALNLAEQGTTDN